MAKYKIWDKKSTIYTLTGATFTAQQWLEQYPWANLNGVKMVIGGGVLNGTVAMEFEAMKETFAKMGCDFSECTTDKQVLAKIEEFEDNPNKRPSQPTVEERTAAALEFLAMNSLPDETV